MSNMTIEDPIQHLLEDHEKVLEVLDDFELAIVDLLGSCRAQAVQRLRDGLEILELEVHAHGKLEESILYPTLGRHLPAQTIETLAAEHTDIRWAMDLLASGLRRGKDAPVTELHWYAVAVVDLLRRHMEREGDVLFGLVSHVLSGSEYETLARAMHEFLHGRPQAV
jgi:hemerythrin-like domain-containing protein